MNNKTKLYFYYGLCGTIFFVRHKPTITAYVHEEDLDFRPQFTNIVLALLDAETEQIKDFDELSDHTKEVLYKIEDSKAEDYEYIK